MINMILRLKRCDSDRKRTLLVAMARQEIEGDLWDQSTGRDLLHPSVCVGFRTLSEPPTSAQNVGSRDPRVTKLALDQASRSFG
jgi:hypothetical protein